MNELVWHDGVLKSISVAMGEGQTTLRLHVLLPEKLLSPVRNEHVIAVEFPSRVTLNIDLDALRENTSAGNITDAKVFDGPSAKIVMVLAEGHVEAVGRSVKVTRLAS